ncbi:hypothetical protein AGOR_G00032890 [Albula goreensis]|uniref:C-type lectin domain-containing protein n=1 Tax=Albula goreensis TaxID=1534307 RepID=A0A8T3DY63_9TELE|nr:hypothetical protein AGOR_G00032890 [Albula goreensis]
MKQSVFALLLISGLCTLCSCLSRQYHFVNIEKSWTEAQSYCSENYADLATIDNQEEMEALMGVVGSSRKTFAWIGLYDDRDSWQWCLADRGFYSEGESEFRNWASGEPNNNGGREHCVYMSPDGKWDDASCDTRTGPFICYDGDAAHRYILIKEKKTWREAQSYCRKHHTDLASVRNQTENQQINQTAGGQAMWIGLFRESWKWSDQSNSSYRYWEKGQPNNLGGNDDCAGVKVADLGRWFDLPCHSTYPFICYEDNLVLVRENKSWDEALSYCRQHYGDLVSVSTEQLQHWVKRRAQSASTAHVWLGLRYSCALHFWFWVSGEEGQYQNWAPGNETGECGHRGAVESGGGQQWVSLPQTEKLNFICNKRGGEDVCDSGSGKKLLVRMELTETAALNMKDPAVRRAIFQKIEKKLKEQGMPEFKLRWRRQPNGELFLQRKEDEEKKEGCKKPEV